MKSIRTKITLCFILTLLVSLLGAGISGIIPSYNRVRIVLPVKDADAVNAYDISSLEIVHGAALLNDALLLVCGYFREFGSCSPKNKGNRGNSHGEQRASPG